MVKMHIVNKRNVKKRLKSLSDIVLTTLLTAGTMGLTIGLPAYIIPRSISQIKTAKMLDDVEISPYQDISSYKEEIDLLKQIEQRNVLFPGKIKAEVDKFKKEVSNNLYFKIKYDIDAYLYDYASLKLKEFRELGVFTDEEISDLEGKVEAIRPENLFLAAENPDLPPKMVIKLIDNAERGLKALGKESNEASQRKVSAYIDIINTNLRTELLDNIPIRIETIRSIYSLYDYIITNPLGDLKIEEERWNDFISNSKLLMRYAYEENILNPETHLKRHTNISDRLGYKGQEEADELAKIALEDIISDGLDDNSINNTKANRIKEAGKINELFNLGRNEDIAELYIHALVTTGDSSMIRTNLDYIRTFPEDNRKEMLSIFADVYLKRFKSEDPKERYFELGKVKEWYKEAGIPDSDPRIKIIDDEMHFLLSGDNK